MRRLLIASLLVPGALALGGCVAGMAVGAAGLAARSMQGTPKSNAELRPAAIRACSERAAPMGIVHIIDAEQRAIDKIVVWGTADNGTERRSFECSFRDKITGFRVRKIRAAQ